ncbi:DUF2937 family protein [Paracraurococcus lichenis]|uniref:DUF2937 family protein n=1 Tax=Paracraurococcus lichenis TaxID=3064888 RepID=A0ABT9DYK1_9PROT|nr:DUF2937 family protein [Paracraurococcus sp. LOR1-02]MDO9708985.1 DUF2937 family protein [Paracraurococcus sp. LOR1-02]
MLGFLGRGFADALRVALPLLLGVALMQVPAIMHGYSAGLLQAAEALRSDIGQRTASARRHYGAVGEGDEALLDLLRQREPANAEGLEGSIGKARALRAAHERIEAAMPALRPVTALLDLSEDPLGDKRAVLRLALDTHVPQIAFDRAGILWLVLGILLGAFLARLVIALLAAPFGGRRRAAR